MLNEVKHLAYVSCQVPARDPSYRQDDNRRRFCFVDNCYIIPKNITHMQYFPKAGVSTYRHPTDTGYRL